MKRFLQFANISNTMATIGASRIPHFYFYLPSWLFIACAGGVREGTFEAFGFR
jgi:hypothetical protein